MFHDWCLSVTHVSSRDHVLCHLWSCMLHFLGACLISDGARKPPNTAVVLVTTVLTRNMLSYMLRCVCVCVWEGCQPCTYWHAAPLAHSPFTQYHQHFLRGTASNVIFLALHSAVISFDAEALGFGAMCGLSTVVSEPAASVLSPLT